MIPHTRGTAKNPKRIALIGLPLLQMERRGYTETLLKYAEENNWHFICSLEPLPGMFRFIQLMNCDGAIARIISPKMKEEALGMPFPVVNISSWLEHPGMPTVRFDNAACGRICAEYLLGKGFRRFATVRIQGGWLNQARLDSFVEGVQGAEKHGFQLSSDPPSPGDLKRFRKWIRGLRMPIGLFLTDNKSAQPLMDACKAEGLRIPQDVAVLAGFGIDEHPVHPLEPSLTCVVVDEGLWLLEAIRQLDRMISGKRCSENLIEVPPKRILEKDSTNTIPADDPLVAKVLEHIRGHAVAKENIKTIAFDLLINRRTLDRRFKEAMGITVHEFLMRERGNMAIPLLNAKPRLKLEEIARRCNFCHARHMKEYLRSQFGIQLDSRRRS